ncbi:hypothetical protein B0H10DRAFT_2029116 [Mycena sp. CBHHK59/15]|nr:hypothetical protein B0H10DRAFT_2029116 [Mycena sp. CBHHK59/15]
MNGIDPAIFCGTPRARAVRPRPTPPPPPLPTAPPPSTQPRLRARNRTDWEKADSILNQITKDLGSLGHFLELLFYNRIKDVSDPRTPGHKVMVSRFLSGQLNISVGKIIALIYHNRQSQPPKDSPQYPLAFSPPDVASPRDIDYARPTLATWALQTVGPELRREVGLLTRNDPDDLFDTTQLRASPSRIHATIMSCHS